MVEIHLMRQEHALAIQTGDLAESPEKFDRRTLTSHDSVQLALTVACVVPDVIRVLVAGSAHLRNMAMSERGVNGIAS